MLKVLQVVKRLYGYARGEFNKWVQYHEKEMWMKKGINNNNFDVPIDLNNVVEVYKLVGYWNYQWEMFVETVINRIYFNHIYLSMEFFLMTFKIKKKF